MIMEKANRVKPYKSASPADTVCKIRSILHNYDIFVIETSQKKDPITGVCSTRIILGDDRLRDLDIGSNGKGMTTRYSLASAYAEFMERLQNGAIFWKILGAPETLPGSITVSAELFEECVVKLFQMAYGTDKRNNHIVRQYLLDENSYSVVPFFDYISGEKILIPVRLFNEMTGSNGMAAGNTTLEATIQGLSEIFEREAIQQLFLHELTPPQIDEEIFKDQVVLEKLNKLRNQGIDYRILDCSLGKGLPVIGLLITKNQRYHIHFGADPSPITALERCLTEIFQGREVTNLPLYEPMQRTDDQSQLFRNEQREYTDSTGRVPIWLIEGPSSWKFESFPHPVTISDEDDMKYYLSILEKMGKKLYIRETGSLGVPSVRLYVPGITENHLPNPELCIRKKMPRDIQQMICRLPLLSDSEFSKLANLLNEWLQKDLRIETPYQLKNHDLNLKNIFPIGTFPCRKWDDLLLVAAIYIRGGLFELGQDYLNYFISERGFQRKEAELLMIRLRSKKLMFLLSEWPQCPECDHCRARVHCRKKEIEEFAVRISAALNKNFNSDGCLEWIAETNGNR